MHAETIEYIVKALVDYPDQVSIEESSDGSTLALDLTVADSDMGRVIGRGGRVINALRTVAQAIPGSEGREITIEVE
jgi:predicted RNA-binding protein YlqC (UPF0109 family)